MWKRLNQGLNVLIGAFIGVFLGSTCYECWHRKRYPELYAMRSAPWYVSILLWGMVTVVVIAVALFIKWLIRRKVNP